MGRQGGHGLVHSPPPKPAILIMTEFSLLREAPALKPPKATAKPYTRHRLRTTKPHQGHTKATPKPHQSHTKATPRPHQGHTKATPKPHQSHTKATPKPTTQAISMAGGRGNRLFSQGLGHNENCCTSLAGGWVSDTVTRKLRATAPLALIWATLNASPDERKP